MNYAALIRIYIHTSQLKWALRAFRRVNPIDAVHCAQLVPEAAFRKMGTWIDKKEQEQTRATKQKYLQLAALQNTRSKMLKSRVDAATHKGAVKRAMGRLVTGEIEADPDRASKRLRKRKPDEAAGAAE